MIKIIDRSVGIYRSRDPIKNFKIKIHLKKVVPLTILAEETREDDRGVELSHLDRNNQYEEQYTFEWQEKVFSRQEIEWYSNIENCVNFVEKKYHEDVLRLKEETVPKRRLYTYVNADVVSGKFDTEDAADGDDALSPLLERSFADLKLGRGDGFGSNSDAAGRPPNGTTIRRRQRMYLMADLNPLDEEDLRKENEVLLCAINIDSNNVITVSPDFCKRGEFYETHNDKREVFRYSVEHASPLISAEERQREKDLMAKVYDRHTELVSACLDGDFKLPPPQTFGVFLFGEIVSARDFELDNLYVHYFFELPENWQMRDERQIAGVTHTCATTTERRDDVAYFSFPFEAEFIYKVTNVTGREMMPKWPQLFLEVVSFDRWKRYCVEGYTHMVLPSEPGSYSMNLATWRPITHDNIGNLRRFFIGGSTELEDITYTGVLTKSEENQMSHLGFETQSSGSVNIRLNIVHQSEIFAMEHRELRKKGGLLNHLDATSIKSSISVVLSAFQRARSRMLAARSGLEKFN
ncbi:Meckel syndrome type 1 protein-like [Centruroides sculpturatus]|uniref:Meckel syndrome type 1 protein-like n=1 Tax=Centruroides sculpturatus TaxID=218467 RepID=UPI000C6E741B|nr:Meckel syndrome type 1 protein-like [Centruroides sculpturatus]